MEVRDGYADALTARDRCLQAVIQAGDVEEGRALWRAGLAYHRKARELAGERGEIHVPGQPFCAPRLGGSERSARESVGE